MLNMSSETGENDEDTCVVCFKEVDIYSIGVCDHMVCYECSTRMRVLCCQNECPICRQYLPKVIFTKSLKPFSEINSTHYHEDRKYKVLFQNKHIQQAFYKLLENNCYMCPNKFFKIFPHLNDHMEREHDLYYCDLCVEHLKIFPFERRCYSSDDLAEHKRVGDQDDRSHRGHPLCEFCQTRFMDNDFLYRHLRKEHLFCHFCDADGRDLYYSSYDFLREHFQLEHYLCEEGACIDEKFTSVFRTEIDLKAHKMSAHGKSMGKVAARQARTLELEFTVKPRSRQLESAYKFRTVDSRSSQGAAALSVDSPPKPHSLSLNPSDFPSLPSCSGSITVSSVHHRQPRTGALTIHAVGRRNAPLTINDENFPALGDRSENSQGTSVRLNINQDRSVNNSRNNTNAPPRNVSIHVNHKPNGEQNIKKKQDDFPALPSDSRASSLPSAKWVRVPNKKTTANSAPKQEKHSKPPASGRDFPELSTRFNSNLNLKSKEPLKPKYVNSRSSKGNEKNTKKASSVLIPVREDGLRISEASTSNAKAKTKNKKSKSNITHVKLDTTKKKADKGTNTNSRGITEKVENKSSTCTENSDSCTTSVKPLPTVEDWFGDDKKLQPESERKDDETIEKDDETTEKADETIEKDDGTIEKDDGTIEKDDGTIEKADETIEKDDGTIEKDDGTIEKADETIEKADETIEKADGTIEKDDETIEKDDEIIEKDVGDKSCTDSGPSGEEGAKNVDLKDIKSNNDSEPQAIKQDIKAPPGFDRSKKLPKTKPPPGFAFAFPCSNNLTFTNSSGQIFAIPTNKMYALPPNFEKRNKNLVKKIFRILITDRKFEQFKKVSGLFRHDVISADEYCNRCVQIMGEESFLDVYPELLALLPDIKKQHELYEVYSHSSKSELINTNLHVCELCRQILSKNNVKDHADKHKMNDFPFLMDNNWT